MGYRSQVGLVIPESAPRFEQIDDIFDQIDEKGGYRLYICEAVKWYDEFPVVKAVTEYVNKHEDDCILIILGEDDGDIETTGSLWENPFGLGYVRNLILSPEFSSPSRFRPTPRSCS